MPPLAIAALCSLFAGACAPGLRVDEGSLRDRTADQGKGVGLVDVTPSVLARQVEERQKKAESRPKDPLADEALNYQYRVAPQDILFVIVYDHPELTLPAGQFREPAAWGNPVNADGTVYYPYSGLLPVAGRTLPEIRQALTEKLALKMSNPQLDVRVAAFRGKRVQVTGEVVQPGTLPITDVPMRVQDAIGQARGLTPEAWTRAVALTRGGRTHWLNLQALYDEGDLSQNWLLVENDLLHVPHRGEYKVFVLGEVRQPLSRVMVRGRMSLAEALSDSSGLDPVASNASAIYVFRGAYERPIAFKLNARSADAMLLAAQFQLEPHDVVFVDTYKLTSWNRVVTQILPTVQGIWQTLDIGNRAVGGFQ